MPGHEVGIIVHGGRIHAYLEDPVMRHLSTAGRHPSLASHSAFLPTQVSRHQDLAGRVVRYTMRGFEKLEEDEERIAVARGHGQRIARIATVS